MNTRAAQLLKQFDLRQTDSRLEILSAFHEDHKALSHSDLEHQLGEQLDRVTIYRTLKTFLDKGILHKVLDDVGGTKYALCPSACTHKHHQHEHVHFKCQTCGQTTCLDSVQIPAFGLPAGYRRQEVNILVQGICPSCNQ